MEKPSSADELKTWFLGQLDADIRARHPAAAKAFDTSPPENDGALDRWVQQHLTFPPVEPWSSLCQAMLSIDFGIAEMRQAIRGIANATDGHAAWFHVAHTSISIHSVLDRLQFLARRMSRGKNALVDKTVATSIDAKVQQLLDVPEFASLRNSAAHGPQQQMAVNWFGAASSQRLWELMALNGEDGRDMADGFFDDALSRLQSRHQTLTTVADIVVDLVERSCSELLDVAKAGRQAPKPP